MTAKSFVPYTVVIFIILKLNLALHVHSLICDNESER